MGKWQKGKRKGESPFLSDSRQVAFFRGSRKTETGPRLDRIGGGLPCHRNFHDQPDKGPERFNFPEKGAGAGIRAIIINSGNANACTGDAGTKDALQIAEKLSSHLGCDAKKILMASTGVIGRPLNMEAILPAIPRLLEEASRFGHEACAKAIMTTDTRSKSAQAEGLVGGNQSGWVELQRGSE